MKGKYFIDTNIIVYAFDESSPKKQARALRLIEEALVKGVGVLSTQVVQEFLNVALKKFAVPLRWDHAQMFLTTVLAPLCNIFPSIDGYQEALLIHSQTGFGFYDSLIVSSAIKAECEILYSEDLQHGRTVRGTRIINPFLKQ